MRDDNIMMMIHCILLFPFYLIMLLTGCINKIWYSTQNPFFLQPRTIILFLCVFVPVSAMFLLLLTETLKKKRFSYVIYSTSSLCIIINKYCILSLCVIIMFGFFGLLCGYVLCIVFRALKYVFMSLLIIYLNFVIFMSY